MLSRGVKRLERWKEEIVKELDVNKIVNNIQPRQNRNQVTINNNDDQRPRKKTSSLLLLAAAIFSIRVISHFRVDERRGISSCLLRGDEAEVTIRYFLSVEQERGSERARTFIVREEEAVVCE